MTTIFCWNTSTDTGNTPRETHLGRKKRKEGERAQQHRHKQSKQQSRGKTGKVDQAGNRRERESVPPIPYDYYDWTARDQAMMRTRMMTMKKPKRVRGRQMPGWSSS